VAKESAAKLIEFVRACAPVQLAPAALPRDAYFEAYRVEVMAEALSKETQCPNVTPEERAARLCAKAEVILADARARAEKRIRERAAKTLDKARRLVADAASGLDVVDAAKAEELREWAGRMPSV
jgi:hypothetical protein